MPVVATATGSIGRPACRCASGLACAVASPRESSPNRCVSSGDSGRSTRRRSTSASSASLPPQASHCHTNTRSSATNASDRASGLNTALRNRRAANGQRQDGDPLATRQAPDPRPYFADAEQQAVVGTERQNARSVRRDRGGRVTTVPVLLSKGARERSSKLTASQRPLVLNCMAVAFVLSAIGMVRGVDRLARAITIRSLSAQYQAIRLSFEIAWTLHPSGVAFASEGLAGEARSHTFAARAASRNRPLLDVTRSLMATSLLLASVVAGVAPNAWPDAQFAGGGRFVDQVDPDELARQRRGPVHLGHRAAVELTRPARKAASIARVVVDANPDAPAIRRECHGRRTRQGLLRSTSTAAATRGPWRRRRRSRPCCRPRRTRRNRRRLYAL